MIINVEQEVPVWLIVGGLDDSSHVVDNSRCVQVVGICMLYSVC